MKLLLGSLPKHNRIENYDQSENCQAMLPFIGRRNVVSSLLLVFRIFFTDLRVRSKVTDEGIQKAL